ncbi:MAG TPA: cupin domain-containing protein [Verrucomicrobiae bacterium]|nr:cupin domain-containing protein [Verrucomicrobiae bacterium]
MDLERVRELAALNAAGAIDGEDAREFAQLLADRARLEAEISAFNNATARAAEALPVTATPSASVKERLMQRVGAAAPGGDKMAVFKRLLPPVADGFFNIRDTGDKGWLPLPVRGAFVKLLSFDEAQGYAIVLGKLDPGASYPAHNHHSGEDLFMLTGDLHIGGEKLTAGDFHHAAAGSSHGINYSEQGCTLLAVLSGRDLLEQLEAGKA